MLSDKTKDLLFRYAELQRLLEDVHYYLKMSLEKDTYNKVSLCKLSKNNLQLYKSFKGSRQDIEDIADNNELTLTYENEQYHSKGYSLSINEVPCIVVLDADD